MPPSVLAGLAALVAAVFWLLTRQRLLRGGALDIRGFDHRAIAALNRAEVAQAAAATAAAWAAAPEPQAFRLPATARARAVVLRGLSLQLAGPTSERLAAIEAAEQWGARACLPLLQRGLRDVDPEVVRAAARAMERFRGRSAAAPGSWDLAAEVQVPLPRNVARTR